MKNACFISYRHPGNETTARIYDRFARALEARLSLNVAGAKVYLDEQKLKLGDLYQNELAIELCRSACMVLLFNRSYFDLGHTFCAREYKAMVAIEQRRLQQSPHLQNKGLILTVAFRNPENVPAEIKDKRHYLDVSKLTLSARAFDEKRWLQKLDEIADAVAERYHLLGTTTAHAPGDCDGAVLPAADDIAPWLRGIVGGHVPMQMPGH